MELSLHNKSLPLLNGLGRATRQLLQPFFDQDQATVPKVQPFIMPLELVEARLHEHYVSQGPLDVTYEYYDARGQIQLGERTVTIHQLLKGGRYHLRTLDDQLDLLLDGQQILRVK